MKELIYHRSLLPTVDRYADKTLIIDGGYRASYAEHADRVFRLANALKDRLDIARSDRFAVMALNSHQYLELYHAAFLGAGIINPLNLRLAGKELDYILHNSGTEVIFADAYFAGAIKQVLESAEEPHNVRSVVLIGEGDVPHDLSYEELIDGADSSVPEEPEEEDPVVLMYTAEQPDCPKVFCSTTEPRCSTCTTSPSCSASTTRLSTSSRPPCSTPPRWAQSWAHLRAVAPQSAFRCLIPQEPWP